MRRSLYCILSGLLMFGTVACSSLMDGSNEISVRESRNPGPDAGKSKYAASIRIAGYADERKAGDARKIGVAKVRVMGLSGSEIRLDRDASAVVADSIRKQLDDAGFPMLGREDQSAMFELSGAIKELSYDVKERDFVSISVDSTLKEIATGKVVWSGEVVQKSDRFAGVSGNNKEDIANYLHKELGVVAGKTAEAVSSVLMATRPDLFNLTPGTKAIPGVEVFVAPNGQGSAAPDTAMLNPMHEAPGTLVVRTEPARAKVYLDGVYFGLSPLNIESAAGIRVVEVKLKGYKRASEKVAVRTGALTELEFQLEK
ncbi:MAG: PEGA domain-containing protein [Nitrosomonadales bacterium]|nr:PEGA domain-containing protein [Nitrosomonadales bacterium]